MSPTLILNHQEISLKLDRIAWQILEQHFSEKSIVLVGLADRGTDVAQKLASRLENNSSLNISTTTINLDKKNPLTSESSIVDEDSIYQSAVILVDDVLNSGITLAAALKEILNFNPKSVRTAVLANRDHHKFPIQANYVGISLATTLKQHIYYEEKNGQMTVTLS